jgi:imidazolonepropionase-like amidohydrolase
VTTAMLGKSSFYPLHKEWQDWDKLEKIYGSYEIDPLKDSDGKLKQEAINTLSGFLGTDPIPEMEVMLTPIMKKVKKLYSKGVNIVMGTDVGGKPYILPGLSSHEEMQLMQLGGLNPLDIIKISTHNGAKMLGILDEYGTLEKGKYADMVLLNKNPLEDISNTQSIFRVIKEGIVQERILQ